MNTRISEVLARKGHTVHATTSQALVGAAVEQLNFLQVGALAVLDEGKLIGMFSERDVLRRVIAARKDPWETMVAHVMTSPVNSIDPGATVEEALRLMTDRRHRHLPVIEDGTLIGMVSQGDLTKTLTHGLTSDVNDLVAYVAGTYPFARRTL